MGYLLVILYVLVSIIGWIILTDWSEDKGFGFMASLAGTFGTGVIGLELVSDSYCYPLKGDLKLECLNAMPFEYFFIPVGVLAGLALITALFVYRKAISRFFTGSALSIQNFVRLYRERFLKYREEKRVVSNAETIFKNKNVPIKTLEAIRANLCDRKECLEKIPTLEKRLVALNKHRNEWEKIIKIATEQAKKQDLDAKNGCFFAGFLEDMNKELQNTKDSILITEQDIVKQRKCLKEARSFLAVVPGEKEYYAKASELAAKVLKEAEMLKKGLSS